jgi:hypothetical protein
MTLLLGKKSKNTCRTRGIDWLHFVVITGIYCLKASEMIADIANAWSGCSVVGLFDHVSVISYQKGHVKSISEWKQQKINGSLSQAAGWRAFLGLCGVGPWVWLAI